MSVLSDLRIYFLPVLLYAIFKLHYENKLESDLESHLLPAVHSTTFFDEFYHTDRTHLELVIQHDGYLGEKHEFTTEDGFNIMLHRIKPAAKRGHTNEPVLMVHGIVINAAAWLVLIPKYNLAYQLSNAGYDIWLFSSRGKLKSRGHISLEPDDPEYWNWGQDEIGMYDIPAAIDYILRVSGKKTLSIVGYSLGVSSIFLALSERPELNSKVQSVISFAPALATSLKGKGFVWGAINQFLHVMNKLNLQSVLHGQMTGTSRAESQQNRNCSDGNERRALPTFYGEDLGLAVYSPEENAASIYRFICINIGRLSWKTMIHVWQTSDSGRLVRFDYGAEKNLELYGSEEPPPYDLGKLNVPIHIFYGLGDTTVRSEEVTKYCDILASLGKDVQCIQVANPNFGHADFVMNKDAQGLVYDRVLAILNKKGGN